MKKLTLLVLAILGSLCGYSQMIEYPKNQVSAFFCNGQSLYSFLDDTFGGGTHEDDGKADGKESWKYTDFSNTYNVEYFRRLPKRWLSIGVQAGYEETLSNHWINRKNREQDSKPTDNWTEKDRLPYIMAAIQFDWIRYNWIGGYMKSGVGARLIIKDKKYETGDTDKAFGCVPCFVEVVGLEIGPKIVRAFGEIGLGAQGFASFGIRSRF